MRMLNIQTRVLDTQKGDHVVALGKATITSKHKGEVITYSLISTRYVRRRAIKSDLTIFSMQFSNYITQRLHPGEQFIRSN